MWFSDATPEVKEWALRLLDEGRAANDGSASAWPSIGHVNFAAVADVLDTEAELVVQLSGTNIHTNARFRDVHVSGRFQHRFTTVGRTCRRPSDDLPFSQIAWCALAKSTSVGK
jgi:hypothetical protein